MKDNGTPSTISDIESGFENQGDILVPSNSGNSVKNTTIVLMVLFTVGAGCLWFMIKKTSPDSADAAVETEEVQIDTAIAKITNIKKQMDQDMGQIVEKFNQINQVEQVAVSELTKNPFRQNISINVSDNNDNTAEMNRNRLEKIRAQVNDEAKKLRLQSLMSQGPQPCCMLNDKLYYIGDTVKGFEVVKINEQSLDLISNGVKVTLRMP